MSENSEDVVMDDLSSAKNDSEMIHEEPSDAAPALEGTRVLDQNTGAAEDVPSEKSESDGLSDRENSTSGALASAEGTVTSATNASSDKSDGISQGSSGERWSKMPKEAGRIVKNRPSPFSLPPSGLYEKLWGKHQPVDEAETSGKLESVVEARPGAPASCNGGSSKDILGEAPSTSASSSEPLRSSYRLFAHLPRAKEFELKSLAVSRKKQMLALAIGMVLFTLVVLKVSLAPTKPGSVP